MDKVITIDGRDFPVDKIASVGMNLDRDLGGIVGRPWFDIDCDGQTHSTRCRNANTVGCLICGIGTFINSKYHTRMQVKSVEHPDGSHVVQFIVETWHE